MSRAPELVAADAGFYSAKNEAKAGEMGVQRVSFPKGWTKTAQRKRRQKERWFKRGQRYKGQAGIKPWVGLGVIADNLINIATAMANRAI